jgi:hypothetical protein
MSMLPGVSVLQDRKDQSALQDRKDQSAQLELQVASGRLV